MYDDIDLEQRSIVDRHFIESTMDFQNDFSMPSVKEVLGLEPSLFASYSPGIICVGHGYVKEMLINSGR